MCVSAQISIAKVALGVFGVAVVVILIAVPMAIFLKGELLYINSSDPSNSVETAMHTRHHALSLTDCGPEIYSQSELHRAYKNVVLPLYYLLGFCALLKYKLLFY